VGVIDGFEVVQIDQPQAERAAGDQLVVECLVKAAAIEQTRQGIRVGRLRGFQHLAMAVLDLLAQLIPRFARVDASGAHQGDDLEDHLAEHMTQGPPAEQADQHAAHQGDLELVGLAAAYLLEPGIADGIDDEPVRVGEGVVVEVGLALCIEEVVGAVGHLLDEPAVHAMAKQVPHIRVQQDVACPIDQVELP
jgi:hypothetical protein